jgi:7-cyano-7-deazaguanine synthase
MTRSSAIILVSGGLDSTTCLAIARSEGFSPLYSMSFDYGQRHRHELEAAAKIAKHYAVREHRVVKIDLRQFGGSALTADIDVPKDRQEQLAALSTTPSCLRASVPSCLPTDLPITYVPARNTIFLSYALAWAEVLNCNDVFIGVNALDYSGYPDCRPDFIESFQQTARLGTKRTHFQIHAPLIRLTKAQIIQKGTSLGVDYAMTHSCYDPDPQGRACGRCDSCLLRKKGFTEAGVGDPTVYG